MGKKRRRFNPVIIENVTIGAAVAEGNCIARIGEKVAFVKYAAPDDVADIELVADKKRYFEAKIVNLKKASLLRTDPFCKHFGVCGGCKWQHLSYKTQLEYKEQQVKDAFSRIGKIDAKEWLPIVAAPETKYYRNKLEFTFSNKAWEENFDKNNPQGIDALGFHVPGRFDKVLNIETCFLMPDLANAIRLEIRDYASEVGIPFFDIREQKGMLRNVMIRCSNKGDWMVLVVFYQYDEITINNLMKYLQEKFPQITSLLYTVNSKPNDMWNDRPIEVFAGKFWIEEKMEELTFRIRPQSFFQTNSKQAIVLYSIARDFAALTGKELVYDLYTGTGTIAQFISKEAKKVVGIEYVEAAVADAHDNALLNNIHNTVFYAGDMKEILTTEFAEKEGIPDVVITDPPRDGMHKDVVERLLLLQPEKIVYVSCNPATQARDIALLSQVYEVVKVQPVDMFPHTHHVESVALLMRKSN